jgi:vacuolar-type H+-ATPase subunit D/Vma8
MKPGYGLTEQQRKAFTVAFASASEQFRKSAQAISEAFAKAAKQLNQAQQEQAKAASRRLANMQRQKFHRFQETKERRRFPIPRSQKVR